MPRQETIDDEFLKLLSAMSGRFRRLARVYAASEDCDDLVQEMRLQLWKAWPTFSGRAQPTTWGYRVAINTALMHRRKHKSQPAKPASLSEPTAAGGQTHATQKAILAEFLASLKPVDRAVFVLFLEDVTRAEMVEILGMTASAIASRLNRIKAAFRTTYVEVEK